MTRTDRIDAAVADAGQFLGLLLEKGPINPEQAHLIVTAAAKAAVPDAGPTEIRLSAARTATELERLAVSRTPPRNEAAQRRD